VVAALAAATLGTSTATAGEVQKYATTVTIEAFCYADMCPSDFAEYGAFGKVDSSKRKCRIGRRVNLYNKVPDQPDPFIGFAYTNSNGDWFVSSEDYPTVYATIYAKAPRTKLRRNRVCKPATSSDYIWS
jgi:hypothetical protein